MSQRERPFKHLRPGVLPSASEMNRQAQAVERLTSIWHPEMEAGGFGYVLPHPDSPWLFGKLTAYDSESDSYSWASVFPDEEGSWVDLPDGPSGAAGGPLPAYEAHGALVHSFPHYAVLWKTPGDAVYFWAGGGGGACGCACTATWYSEYMHIEEPTGISEGDEVEPGAQIGTIASVSGYGSHLHFGIGDGIDILSGDNNVGQTIPLDFFKLERIGTHVSSTPGSHIFTDEELAQIRARTSLPVDEDLGTWAILEGSAAHTSKEYHAIDLNLLPVNDDADAGAAVYNCCDSHDVTTTVYHKEDLGEPRRWLVVLKHECKSGIKVGEVDGSPLALNVSTLLFDQADGFTVTEPVAGTARVDFSPTSVTPVTYTSVTHTYNSSTLNYSSSTFNWTDVVLNFTGNIRFTPRYVTWDVDQHDVNLLATTTFLYVFVDNDIDLTGLQNGFDGRWLLILNRGDSVLTVKHNDAGSSAANRVRTPDSRDYFVDPFEACYLSYSSTDLRWYVHDARPPALTGASAGAAGFEGLVPTPSAGDHEKLLRGDATWAYPLVVRKNSTGSDFGPRRRLNLIEGTGVTLTVADDAANSEVDVTVAASGGVPTFSGARVYHNAVQSISNTTWTALAFNSELFDTDSYHDTVTNNTRLTAPTTGYYLIGGHAQLTGSSFTTYEVRLIVNGSTVIAVQSEEAPGGMMPPQNGSLTTLWQLNSSDYVEFQVWHDHGSSKDIDSTASHTPYFWIARLGA